MALIIGLRGWATRQLHIGDLTALFATAEGRLADDDRIKRLARRGFVTAKSNGRPLITTRGRVALAIKRLIPR